eukprot:GFUD01043058.1.p1 GENE.GFUD01043058.1~~GFUD01043058.1.p1  ORF type:complete len:195 (-),score=30.24 GFUD01043058.1:541-1125(-)
MFRLLALAWLSIVEANTSGLKICSQDNPSLCLGTEGAVVSLKVQTDPTTNWQIIERTGSDGVFIENLQSCNVLTTGGTISTASKTGGLSQIWVLEEMPGATMFDERYFRFYNLAFQTEAFLLTADVLTHITMSGLQEAWSPQQFVFREDSDLPTSCPQQTVTGIDTTSTRGGGPQNCGRGRVSSFGRCQRVFGK